MVRCGSENGHWQDMCLKEIGQSAQLLLAILGSIVNMIGDLLGQFLAPTTLTLKNHSSNIGWDLKKIHRLLLKSHNTFMDPRKILPLISKLRIMSDNQNYPFKTGLPIQKGLLGVVSVLKSTVHFALCNAWTSTLWRHYTPLSTLP